MRHLRKSFSSKNVHMITTSYHLTENVTAADSTHFILDDDMCIRSREFFHSQLFTFNCQKEKPNIFWYAQVALGATFFFFFFIYCKRILLLSFEQHLCVFICFSWYLAVSTDAKECHQACFMHKKQQQHDTFSLIVENSNENASALRRRKTERQIETHTGNSNRTCLFMCISNN